jgi:hypothetical protein
MRDFKLITSTDNSFSLDIDIIDGQADLVFEEQNTQDQRAAVAAYQAQGTIPGMENEGIRWQDLYTNDETLINIDNQVKQNIQTKAGGDGTLSGTYTPLYLESGDHPMGISIYKAG